VSENILELKDFGVGFGEKIILTAVNLQIPVRGVFVLVGPAGTGKSTLLRTLSGFNDANPSLRTWGNAEYAGTKLGEGPLPVLVAQKTRLLLANVMENILNDLPERRSLTYAQQRDVATRLLVRAGLDDLADQLDRSVVELPLYKQRHLALARSAAANPALLFTDEPTTGLEEHEANELIKYIVMESEHRAVLVVVHNQNHARRLGGNIALLAGGWIHEHAETRDFLKNPQTEVGATFVSTGSCDVPSPMAKPEELSEEALEKYNPPPILEEAKNYVSDGFGPRNFLWLKKGRLAGTPKPGILADLDYDMTAIKRVGITTLVNLMEQRFSKKTLDKYGIKGIHFPIKDMSVPPIEDAKKFCKQMEDLMASGEILALHCKAGLGRTGTMLASILIWEGMTALEALEKVRCIEPRWVQSEEQLEFLTEFAQEINADRNPQIDSAAGM